MRGNHVATEPFYVTTEFWPSPEGFLLRQNNFMSRQSLTKTKGFYVAIGIFMSRQSVVKTRGLVLRQSNFAS